MVRLLQGGVHSESDPLHGRSAHQSSKLHRRLTMILEELDKDIEAYRRIDAFFAEEGELLELMEVLGIADEVVLQGFLKLGSMPEPLPRLTWFRSRLLPGKRYRKRPGMAAAAGALYDSQLTEFPKTLCVVQTWLDIRPRQEVWDLCVSTCTVDWSDRRGSACQSSATLDTTGSRRCPGIGRLAWCWIGLPRRAACH